jgi:epoxyqueuosine reductase
MNPLNAKHTDLIKSIAFEHGFSGVTIAKSEFMDKEAFRLEAWLQKGYHGEMHYMENYFDLRTDPTLLVPGSKSVISLMYNYFPEQSQLDEDAPKISKYAYGQDYHKVIRKKLKQLVKESKEIIGDFHARIFVDSAPVLERDWARRSGLGWYGKNTLLIHPKKGSYFFLAEIICDLELEYDLPIKDHCGTCTRCIDACPTDAISPEGYLMDSSKCISYLTIEKKNDLPHEFKPYMENYMYGCDICQDVCPWNRFSTPHNEPAFHAKSQILDMKKSEWLDLSEELFDKLFEASAVKRVGFKGLKRNILFLENHGE